MFLLELDRRFKRAKVIADVQDVGGLDARENTHMEQILHRLSLNKKPPCGVLDV